MFPAKYETGSYKYANFPIFHVTRIAHKIRYIAESVFVAVRT
jgi:hypothetical protein